MIVKSEVKIPQNFKLFNDIGGVLKFRSQTIDLNRFLGSLDF